MTKQNKQTKLRSGKPRFLRALRPPLCSCLTPSVEKPLLSGSVTPCGMPPPPFSLQAFGMPEHSRIAVWVYFHLLCGLLPVPSSVLGNRLSYYFSLLFVIHILFGIIIVWTLASSWVCHLISHSCQARPRLLPSSSVLSFHFAS